jgi:hypothetical protein
LSVPSSISKLSLFLCEVDNDEVIAEEGEGRRLDFGVGVGGGEDIRSLLLMELLVGVDCCFCGVDVFARFSSRLIRLKSFTIAQASKISFK